MSTPSLTAKLLLDRTRGQNWRSIMYIAIPADFNKKTILDYSRINEQYAPNKVYETYGQLTEGDITTSAKPKTHFPDVDMKCLRDYIAFSKMYGIKFNYAFNFSCLSNYELTNDGRLAIQNFIKQLVAIGVDTITVSLPTIIEIIRDLGLDINIVASTICNISSPATAAYYKSLGVSRIVLDSDIIRNFDVLRNIVKVFDKDIELIANSTCIKGCPFKQFHYNAAAHSEGTPLEKEDIYYTYCNGQKQKDPLSWLKSNWIRPEDISLYSSTGIKYFKFSKRAFITKRNPVKAAEHYLKGDYSGNLLELLNLFANSDIYTANHYIDNKLLDGFIKSMYDGSSVCNGVCNECSLCDVYAAKAFNL